MWWQRLVHLRYHPTQCQWTQQLREVVNWRRLLLSQRRRQHQAASSHGAVRYHHEATAAGGGGSNKHLATTTGNKNNNNNESMLNHPLSTDRLLPPPDSRINPAERETILRNTRISRRHMVPELALHLITAECSIYHQPIGDDFCFPAEPFWGFFWPGGQALTRFILDNKQLFAGKHVLDVGAGCGAGAIAARLVGANDATANDIDPTALQATLLNAELNSVDLEISSRNLIGQPCDNCDVLLIGDLFYDTDIAETLIPWLVQLAAKRKNIYIGDPGRHGLTETRLRNMTQVARYRLPPDVCIENNGFSHASVWEFGSFN
ncbi:electron transfer flavoprotein beta subunit lysine methyltransferase-like [Sabethes cyaneus]|uniref:electron transfer flavoprotein beta subunit lysine methyltransferase-like n=1 Tax=Sabethes cyaneus TaxID=53552 RepID=UPI00237E404C|nr:electron transfer flavoprotein beta subunit lysine methyltransferase-like [Sabethes cyaneus]